MAAVNAPKYYLFVARDAPGALPTRLSVRPEHVERLGGLVKSLPGMIHVGGPSVDAEGKPNGTVIVFSGVDEERVREIVNGDPYMTAGVWKDFEIIPFVAGAAAGPSTT